MSNYESEQYQPEPQPSDVKPGVYEDEEYYKRYMQFYLVNTVETVDEKPPEE